jgi:CBS domain containing-hemolysin-like protein
MAERYVGRVHARSAIQTLCLLSLVFGGLLWPLAWLWAYTKPVGYRSAYGTDKHEDYFHEMAEKHAAGELVDVDIAHLREDLAAMAHRSACLRRSGERTVGGVRAAGA